MTLGTKAAGNLASLQTSIDKEASDAQRFVELIRVAVSSGKAHIEGKHGGEPSNSRTLGWRRVETHTGFRSEAKVGATLIDLKNGSTMELSERLPLPAIDTLKPCNH